MYEAALVLSLEGTEARELLSRTSWQRFAPGATVLRKGDPGDSMFVIQDGEVAIPIQDDEGNRLDEFGKNTIRFERGESGEVEMLVVDAVSRFRR